MSHIHETAQISPEAVIGAGTRIWHYVQVRERAHIGQNCIVGKGTYIDAEVTIGDNCKVQNACQVYHGATLEDGVFLGPGVILTNDKLPRAINPDGSLKSSTDWQVGRIHIGRGAAVGAGSVVLPDVCIGTFALVGAGSVVTRDVPDYGLVRGNPARLQGFVCPCGNRLLVTPPVSGTAAFVQAVCSVCDIQIEIPLETYQQLKELA